MSRPIWALSFILSRPPAGGVGHILDLLAHRSAKPVPPTLSTIDGAQHEALYQGERSKPRGRSSMSNVRSVVTVAPPGPSARTLP